MRSYYAHLESAVGSPTVKKAVASKPVFRSSAIFPMIKSPGIHSRILFMGYWILKRNIKEIAAVINLRSAEGKLISRTNLLIQEAKTYRVELDDQLVNAGLSLDEPFIGSLEIEFYSTVNLFFPYPAAVVNYYGNHFSSVVHTAQRTYNDFEDMRNNSQTKVPESGFNIYADDNQEPFFGMVNGGEEIPQTKLKMIFYNNDKEVLEHEMDLGATKPYQTRIIYPAREAPLKDFLNYQVGAAKIQFDLKWVFPRLLVGNIDHSLPALTITHTYYDCSSATSDSDYWRAQEPQWYPASLMVPATITGDSFTNIYFYPIYSPSEFPIDIEFYNSQGKLLGSKKNLLLIRSPGGEYYQLPIKTIAAELKIKAEKSLAVRIIAQEKDGKRIPARIKLGLDMGYKLEHMPCNICTNLQPFNPPLEAKARSFKWAPILADQPGSTFWVMNSAPNIDYKKIDTVELTFFREKDTATLERILTVNPHGFVVIDVDNDPELKDFFGGEVGWVTAVTTNPYTTTWYFTQNESGVVGGDHGF